MKKITYTIIPSELYKSSCASAISVKKDRLYQAIGWFELMNIDISIIFTSSLDDDAYDIILKNDDLIITPMTEDGLEADGPWSELAIKCIEV